MLASPAFAGRGTGQVGYTRAAHWVAGRLAQAGLEPVGDGDTFFQMMPVTRRVPDLQECKITGPGGFEMKGEGNIGFERFTEQGELVGEAVFVHLVGEDPKLAGEIDLRDKLVFYSTDDKARARAPRLLARFRPAAAIRVIKTIPRSVPQIVFEGRASRNTSVSGTIHQAAADKIWEACGLKPVNTRNVGTMVVPSGQSLTIRMRIRNEKTTTPNVVGLIRGSDPQVNDEYIVMGAHLDHLGTRGGDVYFGADDNGSGSTALLSIAEAMVNNEVKPKRSVLFIWFAAEEMGLVGSAYYTKHPLLPLKNMTCMLNTDMVGRNEETRDETAAENEGHIHLVGSQRGDRALHDLILSVNRHIGFTFEFDQEGVFGRSDQINFYEKGVPVAFLFGGFHPDYHQTTDQLAKINFKKVASAARLFYLVAHAAAEHGRFKPNPSSQR